MKCTASVSVACHNYVKGYAIAEVYRYSFYAGTAPLIFNLSTMRRWVFSMLWPLYPWWKSHWYSFLKQRN